MLVNSVSSYPIPLSDRTLRVWRTTSSRAGNTALALSPPGGIVIIMSFLLATSSLYEVTLVRSQVIEVGL